MINVAIAEDNSFSLKSVLLKLEPYPDVIIKVVAQDGKQLIEAIRDKNIEVVLMDIEMPVMNGIEATRLLKNNNPKIKVIALSTFDDDDKIFEMIKAGANGYLLKEESNEAIYKAIYETLKGGATMSPSIALKVINLLRSPIHITTENRKFELTKRELEVLEQLKNGLTYNQIADNLFISPGTVRKHIENIYKKLEVDNRTNAINVALTNRVI